MKVGDLVRLEMDYKYSCIGLVIDMYDTQYLAKLEIDAEWRDWRGGVVYWDAGDFTRYGEEDWGLLEVISDSG